eukprot:1831152-Pleurochrysis_carterae.AAC.1
MYLFEQYSLGRRPLVASCVGVVTCARDNPHFQGYSPARLVVHIKNACARSRLTAITSTATAAACRTPEPPSAYACVCNRERQRQPRSVGRVHGVKSLKCIGDAETVSAAGALVKPERFWNPHVRRQLPSGGKRRPRFRGK